jgi:hypothetical protein
MLFFEQNGGQDSVRTPSIAPSHNSSAPKPNDKGNALFSAAPSRPHIMQPFITPQKSGSVGYLTPLNRGQPSSNVESLRMQQAAMPATPKRPGHHSPIIISNPAPLALPKKHYEHNVPGVRASGHVSGSPVSSQGRPDIGVKRCLHSFEPAAALILLTARYIQTLSECASFTNGILQKLQPLKSDLFTKFVSWTSPEEQR